MHTTGSTLSGAWHYTILWLPTHCLISRMQLPWRKTIEISHLHLMWYRRIFPKAANFRDYFSLEVGIIFGSLLLKICHSWSWITKYYLTFIGNLVMFIFLLKRGYIMNTLKLTSCFACSRGNWQKINMVMLGRDNHFVITTWYIFWCLRFWQYM